MREIQREGASGGRIELVCNREEGRSSLQSNKQARVTVVGMVVFESDIEFVVMVAMVGPVLKKKKTTTTTKKLRTASQ